jgi:hypothetical protein
MIKKFLEDKDKPLKTIKHPLNMDKNAEKKKLIWGKKVKV